MALGVSVRSVFARELLTRGSAATRHSARARWLTVIRDLLSIVAYFAVATLLIT